MAYPPLVGYPDRMQAGPLVTNRYYSDKDIAQINEIYAELIICRLNIQERCLAHRFGDDRAREFAIHGFGRRLSTLVRCIQKTFELVPPESDKLPASNEIDDAEIQIQAFIMNVFGCLDNLAWVWVLEMKIRNTKGAPLDRHAIGLKVKNLAVRASLPVDLRKYLESIEGWFAYLEDYRDALAHQIPLYIPPFAVDPSNVQKHNELDEAITKNIVSGRRAVTLRLKAEQNALKFFRPFIVHSWSKSKPIALHLQMLRDFKTIEAISKKVLDAIAQPVP